MNIISLGWGCHPTEQALLLGSPHWHLSRAGVLPAGALDKTRSSHLNLVVSMTQGRSEIILSVITDTTLKATTENPQVFALHLFGETKQLPALMPSTNGTGYSSPWPLLTGDTYDRQGELCFKKVLYKLFFPTNL